MNKLQLISKISTDKNTLLEIAKAIQPLVDEATIVLDVEGLTFKGMDPSHVAMIDIALPNSCFEKYEVEQEIKFAFNVDEFFHTMKNLREKGTVNLEINDQTLKISQKGETTILKLIEVSATDTPLPKIPYDAKITFGSGNDDYDLIDVMNFKRNFNQVKNVSDYITIDAGDKVILSGKGDNGETKIEYERDQLLEFDVKQKSISTYSIEYLYPYIKNLTKHSSLTLQFSTAKPIRLEFKINNIGRIHLYLAPRVEY